MQMQPTCLGKWCPPSLQAINNPGFVERGGVIPYIKSAKDDIYLILGIKEGKYTDFGGGCKIRKNEKPLECAGREFKEETLGLLNVNPKNTTHIIISGKRRPHQVILFPEILDADMKNISNFTRLYLAESSKHAKVELERIEIVKMNDFVRIPFRLLSNSLKTIRDDIIYIFRRNH